MSRYLEFIRSPHGMVVFCLFIAVAMIVRFLLAWRGKPRWPVTVLLGLMAVSVYFATLHDRLTGLWRSEHRGAYHYFLGAKYFKELGYSDIYRFTALADYESGFRHLANQKEIRDQESYELIPIELALQQAREKRPKVFSDKRWDEFKRDWMAISRGVANKEWERILTDRGFNPPPFWQALAGPAAQFIQARNKEQYKYGLFVDVFLLFASLLILGVLAGADAAFLTFMFMHLAWFYPGSVIGTYFQFVWLQSLILAVAFYRAEMWIPAGACLAISAGTALFPLVLIGGPGLVWLRELVHTRKLPLAQTKFLAAFFVCSALFLAWGLTRGQGPSNTTDWFGKITMHAWHQKFDSNKFGLKRIMSVDPDTAWEYTSIEKRTEVFINQLFWYKAAFVLIVALTMAAMIRGPDEDAWAMALGMCLVFALMTASRYYFLSLLVFFAPGRKHQGAGFAAFAAATLFVISAAYFPWDKLHGDRAAFTLGNYGYFFCALAFPAFLLMKDPVKRWWAERRAPQGLGGPV